MTDFSQTLIARSGYEGEDFTGRYDRYRPAPPPELLRILTRLAQAERPRLVVDLGSGTGLSTRAWVDVAERVVGVEPNPSMIAEAQRATTAANVSYVHAFASETDLPEAAADLVTCAQAFHWMEPAPVLAEAGRILRPGGLFAAYDYDTPPSVLEPEVDAAFAAHFEARRSARARLGLHSGSVSWPKERHLERIRASGRFRYARELVCHGWTETDAERLVGLAESVGGPRGIFGESAPEVGETFERLREAARRVLGDRPRPLLLCYRIRAGVR